MLVLVCNVWQTDVARKQMQFALKIIWMIHLRTQKDRKEAKYLNYFKKYSNVFSQNCKN